MRVKQTIGQRLTILRMDRGKALKKPRVIDLKEVGEALGVSGAAVGQWEADQVKDWSLARLRQLAKYYGARLAWLIDGEGEPYPSDEVVDPQSLPSFDSATQEGRRPGGPHRRAGG